VPVSAIQLAVDTDVSILDHLARYDPYDGGLGADSGSSATCHWINAHAREKGLDAGAGAERTRLKVDRAARLGDLAGERVTELDGSTRGQGVHDLGNARLNSSGGDGSPRR
jgi:hypothetical protein